MDRCHDGRLPNRAAGASESSGTDRMVPLATVRALVDGRISEQLRLQVRFRRWPGSRRRRVAVAPPRA